MSPVQNSGTSHGSAAGRHEKFEERTPSSGQVGFTPSQRSGTSQLPTDGRHPVDNGLSVDGAIPELSDGSALPTHGIYGTGVRFQEWPKNSQFDK